MTWRQNLIIWQRLCPTGTIRQHFDVGPGFEKGQPKCTPRAIAHTPSKCSINDLPPGNRWVRGFNLSQVRELIAIQRAAASTIIYDMDGDFHTTLRWRLLRGFMLWFCGRRCMRCGSTYRVEVDHIIARARGQFGCEYQWMPRNLQILCREHNQEKMKCQLTLFFGKRGGT
jgi:hypothetical protein